MKLKLDKNLVLKLVVVGVIAFAITIVSADDQSSTREGRVVVIEPADNGSFFITNFSKKNTNQYISPIQSADFAFNALVANWELTKNSENSKIISEDSHDSSETTEYFDLSVRFLNESWSDWVPVEQEVDFKDGAEIKNQSRIIPVKSTDTFQYKLVLKNPEDQKLIKSLSFNYVDASSGPNHFFSIAAFSAGSEKLRIISREQWGADESYRFDENGEELWPQEFYTPKKFVIHHTAGEDANKNPAATVRSIYYWHAVGRGWGDIGYNYLIDSQGNIYEGRAGGDGVVGGHAYMKNQNTIGIAILGCYQSDNANACNTPEQLTPATQAALEKLIAVKSQEYGIDPSGVSPFHDEIMPNILGHRDVGHTSCPGNNVYNQISLIKNEARVQLAALPPLEHGEHGAELVQISTPTLSVPANQTKEVVVTFKNTGTTTWHGYEDDHVMIAPATIKNKLAALTKGYTLSFAATAPTTQVASFKLLDGNVAPGEIGRFVMTVEPNEIPDTEVRDYTLAWEEKGYFPNTDFSLNITTLPAIEPQPEVNSAVPAEIASISYSSHTIPSEMASETSYPVTITYTNTGTKSLYKDDLRLKIIYGGDHISPFRNPSWYSEWAMIPPSEAVITPGQSANFDFNLVAPSVATLFPHSFELYYNDQLIDSFTYVLNVVDSYSATVISDTIPIAMLDSWRTDVTISVKNNGSKTWNGFRLKTGTPGYKYNRFIDSSWLGQSSILISYDDIEPGETVDLSFKIDPAYLNGTYRHYYTLVTTDGQEISIDGKNSREFITRVDPIR